MPFLTIRSVLDRSDRLLKEDIPHHFSKILADSRLVICSDIKFSSSFVLRHEWQSIISEAVTLVLRGTKVLLSLITLLLVFSLSPL